MTLFLTPFSLFLGEMSSSWKNQRLQDHFVVLCSELDVNRIVPVLRAERMLTSDEHEQLTNTHYTTRIRREKLLLFIPRKGAAHFEKFAECLVWSGQTELAKKIGIPVEEIAPSPYPTQQGSVALLLPFSMGRAYFMQTYQTQIRQCNIPDVTHPRQLVSDIHAGMY